MGTDRRMKHFGPTQSFNSAAVSKHSMILRLAGWRRSPSFIRPKMGLKIRGPLFDLGQAHTSPKSTQLLVRHLASSSRATNQSRLTGLPNLANLPPLVPRGSH